MRYGVLGTGTVGQTIGTKLIELGHEVRIGSRTEGNPDAVAWANGAGERASSGTFAQAAAFAEALVNCTTGLHSLDALRAAGEEHLADKVVVDISNALDFSGGSPPRVALPDGVSVGEQLQAAFPRARVVKTLNTMNAAVMVEPGRLPGMHSVFLSGEDEAAKQQVRALLTDIGWQPDGIVDLGGIVTARGVELYMPLWLSLMAAGRSPLFNVAVVRSGV